jgi:WD40 repeat protein
MKLKLFFAIGILIPIVGFAQPKPELVTQEKNTGIITKIIYSPNSRYIASANEKDFNIKVWDVQSSKLIGTLAGHEHSINQVTFHPSGDLLFSSDEKNKNYIWDLNSWTLKDSIVMKAHVERALFSPNGNWLYIYTDKSEIWEINPSSPTQQTLFAKTKGLNNFCVTADHLIYGSATREIVVFDANTKKETRKIKTDGIVKYIGADANGIVAVLDNGTINTYDFTEGKLIKSTVTGISPDLCDINEKQKCVAFTDKDKQIQVWNYESGSRLYTLKNADNSDAVKSLSFSKDGSALATSGYKKLLLGRVYSNNNVINVWDIKHQKIIKTLKGDVKPIDGFAFSPGKNELYILRDQELNIWNLNNSERIVKTNLHERKLEIKDRVSDNVSQAKDNTENKVKGTKLDRLKDLRNGDLSSVKDKARDKVENTKNNAIQESKALGKAAFSRLGFQENKIIVSQTSKYLVTALKGDEIRLYKFKEDGMPEHVDYIKTGQKEFYDLLIDPNENFMVVGGNGSKPVSIIPLEGDRNATMLEVAEDDNLRAGGAFQTANAMALTADGSKLVAVFNTGRICVWETSGWYKLTDFRMKVAMTTKPFVGFSKDGNKFFINTAGGVFTYDFSIYNGSGGEKQVAIGDVLSIEKAKVNGYPVMTHIPLDYVVSIDDNNVSFLDVQGNKTLTSDPINSKLITDIQVNKYGYAGVSLRNGELRVYDPATGRQRFIMVEEDDNAIFKTPENYYKITKEGQDLVTFRVGKDAYPFEQFDAKFNRPDIVLKAMNSEDASLITLNKNAYDKRLTKLGLKEADLDNSMHVPTLGINNLADIPLNTDNSTVSLNLIASDDRYDLSKISVWINDVPVYGKKGIPVAGKQLEKTLEIKLASGINKIQVAAENTKGSESLKQTIEIECSKKVKPNLYILSIGTSIYKDKRYNLNYAAKDAQDLVGIFASGNKDVYGSIKTKSITNADATRINIEAVKTFFTDATIDDVVIVFVAGHGILDPNYDYYYGTHDIDFNKPAAKGLGYVALEGILDGIAPLKKMLIMDTCHSGEVDKEDVTTASNNEVKSDEAVVFRSVGPAIATVDGVSPSKMMRELFTDLRRGTGTTVISSAGGAEYAMESDQWKNGLFTYCLLFGLRNDGADLNQDGSIMLSELQLYVTDRVSQLSGGRQVPTTRIQNISLDYRVW